MGAGVEGKDHRGSGSWWSIRGWGGWDGRMGPGTVALSPSPNPAVMMHQLVFVGFFGRRKAAGWAGASEPGGGGQHKD